MSARIWIVDDDRSVRFVLATALREAGYAVEGFDAAQAALDALDTRAPPDLLFTDVRMPGQDGLALLERLKARLPQLPVVVMSANAHPSELAFPQVVALLRKPFELDELLGWVEVCSRSAD